MRKFDDEASEKPMLGSDPAVFSVERPGGTSPYLITCDHASRQLPGRLGTLGLSEPDLARHIAWDIGIAGVARQLAAELDACLILQGYSRLVIDVNRPLGAPDSIVSHCDGTTIPGNQHLSSAEVERRTREIFHPYHDRIRQELDDRARTGRATVLLALHSFTPSLAGRSRPWHVGVLYQRDAELSHVLLDLLRDEPALVVGDNEPYAADDESDYTIVVHGERRGLPHAELELRQDLIADVAGQGAWAARLATLLRRAHAIMFPP
jgi:predicted N-formylglutamate amidohydrolase